MFLSLIIQAILAARRLGKQAVEIGAIPEPYATYVRAGEALYTSVKTGVTVLRHDDGTPVTQEQFDAAFSAAEAQQHATSEHAATRIDQRHTGEVGQ